MQNVVMAIIILRHVTHCIISHEISVSTHGKCYKSCFWDFHVQIVYHKVKDMLFQQNGA